jgi:hypothetical protein
MTYQGRDDRVTDRIMNYGRTFPQIVEIWNRVVTAAATYELARGTHDERVEAAADAIDQTHLDYSEENKPLWFKSFNKVPGGRSILMFKMFAQGMWVLYLSNVMSAIGRNPTLKDKRKEARKFLAYLTVTTAVFAGLKGSALMAEPVRWALNLMGTMSGALGGPDIDDEDWERWMENTMRELTDDRWARLLMYGLPTELGVDLSQRAGWDHLLLQEIRGGQTWRETAQNVVWALIGPNASAVDALAAGADLIENGQTERGLERMMPKFVRDQLRTGRIAEEGQRDLRGNLYGITPEQFSTWDQIVMRWGFPPTNVAQEDRDRYGPMGELAEARAERTKLMRRWTQIDINQPAEVERFYREEIVPAMEANPLMQRIDMTAYFRSKQRNARDQATSYRGTPVHPSQMEALERMYGPNR